jgi:hypothetical protein
VRLSCDLVNVLINMQSHHSASNRFCWPILRIIVIQASFAAYNKLIHCRLRVFLTLSNYREFLPPLLRLLGMWRFDTATQKREVPDVHG